MTRSGDGQESFEFRSAAAPDAAQPASGACALGHDIAARQAPWVGSIAVDGSRVLAHAGCDRPVVLNEVGSVLWDSFDGRATLRSVAMDLAAVRGESLPHALEAVEELAESLAVLGFLVGDGLPDERARPRRLDPPVDPSSCIGRIMGLGRIEEMHEAWVGEQVVLRFGSTIGELADRAAAALDQSVELQPTARSVRTITLRASRGRVPRMQQVFDTLGDPLFASRDLDAASDAFVQTVTDLVGRAASPDDGTTWVDGPAVLVAGGILLLHPAIRSALGEPVRSEILARTRGFLPSALLQVRRTDQGFVGRLPAATDLGPAHEEPVVAICMPGEPTATRLEAVRRMAHLLHRWDDLHLALAADLADRVPLIPIDPLVTLDTLYDVLTLLRVR